MKIIHWDSVEFAEIVLPYIDKASEKIRVFLEGCDHSYFDFKEECIKMQAHLVMLQLKRDDYEVDMPYDEKPEALPDEEWGVQKRIERLLMSCGSGEGKTL